MDPSVVVVAVAAAVSTGTLTGLTESANQAVADAYTTLKGVLNRKYSTVDVAMVEAKPESLARQDVLEAELIEAGVDGDGELRDAAEHVLRLVHEYAPQAAELVGVKLARVRAGELEITNIRARGASGVSAQDAQVTGRFVIKDAEGGAATKSGRPVSATTSYTGVDFGRRDLKVVGDQQNHYQVPAPSEAYRPMAEVDAPLEIENRVAEAIPLYERTLTDRQRVLGEEHPDTLTSRNNLAGAYESVGRVAEAIPLYERTLTDRQRVLGEEHPDTLTSRNNLAGAYESVGRVAEAIPLYERTSHERDLGTDEVDRGVGVIIRGLGVSEGRTESVLLAQPGVREAVVIRHGDGQTVAYLVPDESGITVEAVEQGLRRVLDSYLIPDAFIALDAIPLTPRGKVDRRALPAPGFDAPAAVETGQSEAEDKRPASAGNEGGHPRLSIIPNPLTANIFGFDVSNSSSNANRTLKPPGQVAPGPCPIGTAGIGRARVRAFIRGFASAMVPVPTRSPAREPGAERIGQRMREMYAQLEAASGPQPAQGERG